MIDKHSKEWKLVELAVKDKISQLNKALRNGNKDDQYKDLCTRYETIGGINQLEWLLKLADEE